MDSAHFWQRYWQLIAAQDKAALRDYFHKAACIRWHNTNEQFDREAFLRANCEYPGSWNSSLERVEVMGALAVTACRVWTEGLSFHVVSFFQLAEGKIQRLDEYWGDDGQAPQWRQDLGIGRPIQ